MIGRKEVGFLKTKEMGSYGEIGKEHFKAQPSNEKNYELELSNFFTQSLNTAKVDMPEESEGRDAGLDDEALHRSMETATVKVVFDLDDANVVSGCTGGFVDGMVSSVPLVALRSKSDMMGKLMGLWKRPPKSTKQVEVRVV